MGSRAGRAGMLATGWGTRRTTRLPPVVGPSRTAARFASVDPAKHRARFYDLRLQETLWGGVALVRAWGRLWKTPGPDQRRLRRRATLFWSPPES